ncbi:MAG: 30S ribosomal protein S6 [Firmicutes bacterium]|nr:30S ribosomal protein S6 [Bacillota bacterium]
MRDYEVMYILHPELDDEKTTAAIEKYSVLLQSKGGTVTNTEKWGKRRLSYEIKGQREGTYVLVNFSGEPAVSSELDRVMKISDDVIRHLIIRKGD